MFRLLNKYKGETKSEKKVRLEERAKEVVDGKKSGEGKKVSHGLEVTPTENGLLTKKFCFLPRSLSSSSLDLT